MSRTEEEAKALAKDVLDNVKSMSEENKAGALPLYTKVFLHPASVTGTNYKWSLDDFELGPRLGRGKFGRVYLARENRTGCIFALKTIIKKEVAENHVERQIVREIEIQSRLKHPNILRLHTWFHDDFRIYLVLECAGKGELYKVLQSSPNKRFNEKQAAKYIYQVADALEYCHQMHVIHRDIKPENLLLTESDNIKLGDFGWSVHAPSLRRNTMCGTADYLPPEIINGQQYGQHVDLWCLGILCYEFLVGHAPFESKTNELLYERIKQLDFKFPPFVSEDAKDLISRLLKIKMEERLTLKEVMQHPWILRNYKKEE